ncbi:hypothetical protein Tco_0634206, partial [Tanacetum coccineum]
GGMEAIMPLWWCGDVTGGDGDGEGDDSLWWCGDVVGDGWL